MINVQEAERLSVAYFPGARPDETIERGRAFLFLRDLPTAIMPYRNGRDAAFSASLTPASDELTRWLIGLLDMGGHRSWSLEEALSDFVRDAIQTLSYSGELLFELVPARIEGDANPQVSLAPLPIGRVLRLGRRYYQLIPPHSREELGRRCVALPAERVWRLRLPGALGSPRRQSGLLRRLAAVSDFIPEFALSPTFGSDVAGYDLRAFRLTTDAEVEHLTKHWGSIPSLQQIEGTTEYYYFARTLQFRRSEALIREHIFNEIDGLLGRLGLEVRLNIAGLPKSSGIEQLMRDLEAGRIDFAQAAERSRVP